MFCMYNTMYRYVQFIAPVILETHVGQLSQAATILGGDIIPTYTSLHRPHAKETHAHAMWHWLL